MEKKTTLEEVKQFLFEFKMAAIYNPIQIIYRLDHVSQNGMGLVEYSEEDAIDILRHLTYEDYWKGPEEDFRDTGNRVKNIWFFGKEIEGILFYIKLKLEGKGKRKKPKCISFHPSKTPEEIIFPFKN